MIIEPDVHGFICKTAHPLGCEANVRHQIDYARSVARPKKGPRNILVIGSSTGYGLASRIMATFGHGANSLGVFYDRPANNGATASAGWYNTAAFQKYANIDGIYSKNVCGDAFTGATKNKVVEMIKKDIGAVDLVIYSVAAPRRIHPVTGERFQSVLKPVGKSVVVKGIDTDTAQVRNFALEPASVEEIRHTVAVMGGEDWKMWMDALQQAEVLAHGVKTTAYSYLGGELSWDFYWNGSIGQAKKDLDFHATKIQQQLAEMGGDASVSVLKAVVTQASAAFPVMPLYMSILMKKMKEAGTHEGCIEQIARLFEECLYSDEPRLDDTGRFRVDNLELLPEIQTSVQEIWKQLCTDNLHKLSDFRGYQKDFLNLFGFSVEGINYELEVDPEVAINDLT